MTPSSRDTTLLAVGLLLVTVPLWAPALDVTGDDYVYRSAQLSVEDNRLGFDRRVRPFFRSLDAFRCYEAIPSRACALEARLLDGPLQTDHPYVRSHSGDPSFDADSRYVAFSGDGRVFHRTTSWTNGSYVLGLERISARRALEDVATDEERLSKSMVRAVEEGSVRTDEPLPLTDGSRSRANRVVSVDGEYYVVYNAGRRQFLTAKPFTERLFEGIAVLLGAVLLRRT